MNKMTKLVPYLPDVYYCFLYSYGGDYNGGTAGDYYDTANYTGE